MHRSKWNLQYEPRARLQATHLQKELSLEDKHHTDKACFSLQPGQPNLFSQCARTHAHTHIHKYTHHSLTLYLDLPAGAVRAGQQGELFSLVHRVVCASNYNFIPGSPGLLHFILQIQHHLVHSIHLEAWDWETCRRTYHLIKNKHEA